MRRHILSFIIGSLLFVASCVAAISPESIVAAARSQIGVTTSYDPAYRKIDYPNGDVPKETGVCSDVVVRALRIQGVDLQKNVHEDMATNFDAYPKNWGLKKPDKNIDHRRVPNLMTYFRGQSLSQPITEKPSDFSAGDIVAWDLGKGVTHIGIVSENKSATGTPLIIHNIGRGAKEDDILFGYKIIGHYRMK